MKVALISGASGGIGSATVKLFAENGFFVVGLYNRDEEGISMLKSNLKAKGLSDYFFAFKCDLKNQSELTLTLEKIGTSFKHIDVLVNVAGVDLYKRVNDTTESEWDDVFAVNVKAAFTLTKFALDKMIPLKCGSIVNVSSIWGLTGASMESVYSASKFALVGFTKSVAKEVGESGIRVNCVCPGVVDTKMNDCFNSDEKAELIKNTPIGRMGTPDEVASLIYYLASESAGFITGQAITIDGGFLL